MKKIFTLTSALLSLALSAQTYNGGGGAIPDVATSNFTLNVTGLNPAVLDTGTHGLETVCVNLTHTYDGDLEIYIIAPDGTIIPLSLRHGGGGQNYTNTCFNENSASAISSGSAPFTGTFHPDGILAAANNGQNGNGTWTLRIIDVAAQDQGTLLNWSITFGTNPASTGLFSSSDLPVMIITTNNNQQIPNEPKIQANMKLIDRWPAQRNNITDTPNIYDGNIAIEMRGNFSASLPQKPYNFETRDVNWFQIDTSLLGMPSEHDWCLIACYNDKSFNRNMLASNLFQKMGHYAPRFRLVEVVLNGQYNGVYLLGETIKRDANRVDIAKLDVTDIIGNQLTGGYITKIDYWDGTNSWLLTGHPVDHPNLDVHMVYVYPKADTIVPQQKAYIQQFYADMETALYGSNFADTTLGYHKYISERSWIDYFLVNELARNVDGFKKSRYFYKEKDNATSGALGKLKAGPVWDFDWAWNDIWDCSYFQAQDGSGWSHLINDCGPDVNSPGYYVRLLQDTNFANQLKCRWVELRSTILDTTYLFNFIDSVASRVNEGQGRHFQLYNILGQVTGTPEVNPAYTFAGEIDSLKTWILRRINWLDANMPGTMSGCNLTSVGSVTDAQHAFSLYPNPAHESATVFVENASSAEIIISLTDLAGRSVAADYMTRNESVQLDLSKLQSGMYIVSVTKNGQRFQQRLIRN